MPDYILLCHGGLNEDSAFELAGDQTVLYRGNFGSLLTGDAARRLVQTLRQDATVTDDQIKREIPNYQGTEEVGGPGTFRPDITLQGDDNLMCFIMNMATGKWLPLGTAWRTRLRDLVGQLGGAFTLNLLCCTLLPDSDVDAPHPSPELKVKDWSMFG